MINKVILIGNLGRDPEIRTLESGVKVGKFSMATNENYKDSNGDWQTRTEWHDIVVWRGLAEQAERVLKKGSLAYIEGKLTHRKWEDKDGNPRKTTEVLANTLRILEKREHSGSGGSFPTASDDPFNDQQPMSTSTAPAPTTGTDAVGDGDDLPF